MENLLPFAPVEPHIDIGMGESAIGRISLATKIIEQQRHVEMLSEVFVPGIRIVDQLANIVEVSHIAVERFDFRNGILFKAQVIRCPSIVGTLTNIHYTIVLAIDIDDTGPIVKILQTVDMGSEEQLHEPVVDA